MEKLTDRYHNTKDPAERAHLKSEMDQIPVTAGELDQVQQREADRKTADVKKYREKRKQ
jgi:hypothetical protein